VALPSPEIRRLRARKAALTSINPNHPKLPEVERAYAAALDAEFCRRVAARFAAMTGEQRRSLLAALTGEPR
jgi:hypothetical protein